MKALALLVTPSDAMSAAASSDRGRSIKSDGLFLPKTRERLQRCHKGCSKICARAPRYSKSSLDLAAASSRKRSMRKASIGVLVRPVATSSDMTEPAPGPELEAVRRKAKSVVGALARAARPEDRDLVGDASLDAGPGAQDVSRAHDREDVVDGAGADAELCPIEHRDVVVAQRHAALRPPR